MLKPGDVVVANLPGAEGWKIRPGVVISTDLFLAPSLDVVCAEITTKLAKATTPTDYVLNDWRAAGLRFPSAARVYLGTVEIDSTRWIGHLSDRDWQEFQARLRLALAVT